MDQVLDIFRNDAFSTANLRRVVSNVDYVPQFLRNSGMFKPVGIDTEYVIVLWDDQKVRIIPTTERGAPDIMQNRDKGKMILLKTPRISKIDSVRASELMGVANTALPQNVRIRNAAELVNERTARLKSDKEMTLEYHAMGAVAGGKILDADGVTVVADFYTEFGIAPPALVDVDFPNISEDNFMMFFQDTFLRPTMRVLKDRKTPTTQLGALVGDTFWNKLMTHPGFREIYKLEMQARAISRATNPLVQPNAWMEVDFGGIRWINYMGTDDGTTIAVPTNEVRFFPLNVQDMWEVYYAPGETFSQVGQKGQPEYLMIRPDPRADPEFIDITVRTYALHACLFPQALSRARIKPA